MPEVDTGEGKRPPQEAAPAITPTIQELTPLVAVEGSIGAPFQLQVHETWVPLSPEIPVNPGQRLRFVQNLNPPATEETVRNLLQRINQIKTQTDLAYMNITRNQIVTELMLSTDTPPDTTPSQLNDALTTITQGILQAEGENIQVTTQTLGVDLNLPLIAGATALAATTALAIEGIEHLILKTE